MWFLGTGTLIGSDLSGRDRPGLASLLSGAVVLVTVTLDLLLIPELGAVGAALASVVAYTVFGIASLLALARVSGIGVRTLVLPTGADLALYGGVARRSLAFVRLR
jgi:Na+-driven multidrug efflux pump